MGSAVRQLVRLWATVFVVYAVLLNAMLPSYAAVAVAGEPGPVICTSIVPSSDDPTPLSDHDRHGLLCCVLCSAGVIAALPERVDVGEALSLRVEAPHPVKPASVARPVDPASQPQSPRAPPSA